MHFASAETAALSSGVPLPKVTLQLSENVGNILVSGGNVNINDTGEQIGSEASSSQCQSVDVICFLPPGRELTAQLAGGGGVVVHESARFEVCRVWRGVIYIRRPLRDLLSCFENPNRLDFASTIHTGVASVSKPGD